MLAIGLALVSALGFGSAAIFARLGMLGIRPLPSTLISTVVSFFPSAFLALVFALSDIRALPPIAFLWFLGLGALSFLGGRAQNYTAINLIGAARSTPIVGTSALFAAVFAITITGERPHLLILLGTVCVVAGLVIATGDSMRQSWRGDRKSMMGYILALGAGASYGATNVMAKELIQEYGSPLMVAALGLLFGIIILLPLAGRSSIERLRGTRAGLGFVVFSGLAATTGLIAFNFAVQRARVVVVSPIAAVNPLVTVLLAQIFLSQLEQVTRRVFLGTVLTVLGVVLVIVGSTF